jgi:hypothetical protein
MSPEPDLEAEAIEVPNKIEVKAVPSTVAVTKEVLAGTGVTGTGLLLSSSLLQEATAKNEAAIRNVLVRF